MLESPLTSVLNGSNSPIFFPVPGIADRLEENLKFKQKYLDMSQTTVDQIINSHMKKIKSKKKRKKLQKELILVGIHVRYEVMSESPSDLQYLNRKILLNSSIVKSDNEIGKVNDKKNMI